MSTPSIPAIRLVDVHRYFGEVKAVNGVTLDIHDKEFFTLLGPSGSGKTTLLRLIAGFEQPNSGSIQLFGNEVANIPPYERDVNTVFQDYALFPHMNVEENITYGLMIKKISKVERQQRMKESLDLVRLPGLEKRKPAQLSGGQRQRVALARALVNHPHVLLLDEPLGALDLKLRQDMQIELKSIQERVGITFIYVTHDQEEALAMSDRIAVMNQGRVEQVGSPAELYELPTTSFVAGFIGTSNLVGGLLAERITGQAQMFTIRPEKIRLMNADESPPEGLCSVAGCIRDVIYLGMYTRYLVELEDETDLTVIQQNLDTTSMDVLAARGRLVQLVWHPRHNRVISSQG